MSARTAPTLARESPRVKGRERGRPATPTHAKSHQLPFLGVQEGAALLSRVAGPSRQTETAAYLQRTTGNQAVVRLLKSDDPGGTSRVSPERSADPLAEAVL